MTNIHQQILIEIESHWNNRMCDLVNNERYDDADAVYSEFVLDSVEPDEWMFVEDLNAIR
jgi:hypothetical protein